MFKIMPKGGMPPPVAPPQPDAPAGPPPPTQDPGGPSPDALPPPDAGDDDPASNGPVGKLSQGLVVYMGAEDGPFECGHCLYFTQPNTCQLVDGDIDPKGCCNIFTPSGTPTGPDDPEATLPPDLPSDAAAGLPPQG